MRRYLKNDRRKWNSRLHFCLLNDQLLDYSFPFEIRVWTLLLIKEISSLFFGILLHYLYFNQPFWLSLHNASGNDSFFPYFTPDIFVDIFRNRNALCVSDLLVASQCWWEWKIQKESKEREEKEEIREGSTWRNENWNAESSQKRSYSMRSS